MKYCGWYVIHAAALKGLRREIGAASVNICRKLLELETGIQEMRTGVSYPKAKHGAFDF